MIFLFELHYAGDWDIFYCKMDKAEQLRIWKKIQQLKTLARTRRLKEGLPYFVVEVGQYRIVFEEIATVRILVFVGNHKQYEKWLREQEFNL